MVVETGEEADGKSIMDVLMLAGKIGESLDCRKCHGEKGKIDKYLFYFKPLGKQSP